MRFRNKMADIKEEKTRFDIFFLVSSFMLLKRNVFHLLAFFWECNRPEFDFLKSFYGELAID